LRGNLIAGSRPGAAPCFEESRRMARRTKEEAEKTRSAILDAAEQVFFKRGVARSSLQEVAEAAGVTRGAVYWHFKNKIELVQAMTDRVVLPQEQILQQLEESDSPTPVEDLHDICRENLRQTIHDHRRRRVLTILMRRCEYVDEMAGIVKAHTELRERILGRFLNVFQRARKTGNLNTAWPPRAAAAALHGLMFGLLFNLAASEKEPDAATGKTYAAALKAFFKSVGKQ